MDKGCEIVSEKEILEISTSLAAGSLTLFLGTGFSKYMTNGIAPSWLELLYDCAVHLNDQEILNNLFLAENGVVKKCKVNLTVCAQILEEEFIKHNADIRSEISNLIKEKINLETLDKDRVKQFREFLLKHDSVNIVTTNYDSIITDFVLPLSSKPVVDGKLIPKAINIKPIYHIHGSIAYPHSIILTEGDYFNFLHKENYMSRKLFTLIQETTLVIMGYSLGDFNLNRILNEAKELKLNTIRKSDIYYINRKKVENIYQRYFYSTFGVNVLHELEIDDFLYALESYYVEANKLMSGAERLPLIIEGRKRYKDNFLKLRQSFSHILLRADAFAYSFEDEELQDLILKILIRKKGFTSENNAWDQYEHLADWLCQLGSLFEVDGTKLEDTFIELIKYSFSKMSEKLYIGYSWKSHSIWQYNINYLKPKNKRLIEKMVHCNSFSSINAVDQIVSIKEDP